MNPETPVTPQADPTTTPIETVPSVWPNSSFGLYKHSKAAVTPNVWGLVGLYVISLVAALVLQTALKGVGQLLSYVVSAFISVATYSMLLAGIHGQKMSITEALGKATPLLALKLFVNGVVLTVLLLVSLLLLIIPFFFVLPRLVLAPFMLVDRNLGPVEAIGASWHLTKGNAGKILGVIVAGIAMAALMFTIIGIPFAIYFLLMYSAALPIAYLFLDRQQPAVATEAPALTNQA